MSKDLGTLALWRSIGESVLVDLPGGPMTVTLIKIKGRGSARLLFRAPKSVKIYRVDEPPKNGDN